MGKFKVVITDYEFDTIQPEIEILEKAGAEVVAVQCKTEEEVIEVAKDADGIINQYAPVTRKVIESLENCKIIARYGIGFDTIDVDAATDNKILVTNVTDYCLDEVSDHAFALLISSNRKLVELNNAVKSGTWDFNISKPIFRLRGSVLGLAGLGNIAQYLAKKAQAFGMKVVAYDPFIPVEVAKSLDIELLELNEVCKAADYLSVHTPLNKHTKGLISTEQFQNMKSNAVIINTARGPIIDEKALIEALEQKEIAGAALDVVEVEPIEQDNPLVKMDNVILNPHVSFYSDSSELDLKKKTAQNVADVLEGFFPKYVVNKDLKAELRFQER
ncbi:C-terminal binding protein [Oceanobacillus sp. CFH 90083]|uniref:C-terminal binding protein n=1 Tax=Oceanobacillus sp. CFH 90083 TaxID=2592336 RepID=UPI00128B5724|nr:C-terminal binding protein [Oceanobacillus sp. CFH 90083]